MKSQSVNLDEWTLIGVCLQRSSDGLESDDLKYAYDTVTPEMFSQLDCRKIWGAFRSLHARTIRSEDPTDD